MKNLKNSILVVLVIFVSFSLQAQQKVSGNVFFDENQNLTMDSNGFVITDAEKGMIAAGCAKKASDVVTTTQNSTAAALKAIQVSRR